MYSRTISLLALAVVGASCTPSSPIAHSARAVDDYQARVRAESLAVARSTDTIYQRRMADLIRRSRLVRTDSIARLTVALASGTLEERRRVRDALVCETYVQIRTNGAAAFRRGEERMLDSLRRTGFDPRPTSDRAMTLEYPAGMTPGGSCLHAAGAIPRVPDSLARDIYPTRFMNPPHP